MRKLIASRPVLYLGQMYARGDRLPANNPGMVDAWLAAGSAEWVDDKPLENALPEIKPPDSDNKPPDFNNESGGLDNEKPDFNNESGGLDNEKPDSDNESGDSDNGTSKSENGGANQESAAPVNDESPTENDPPTIDASAAAELAKLTMPELRKRATAAGIDSSMVRNKAQLVSLLAAGDVK